MSSMIKLGTVAATFLFLTSNPAMAKTAVLQCGKMSFVELDYANETVRWAVTEGSLKDANYKFPMMLDDRKIVWREDMILADALITALFYLDRFTGELRQYGQQIDFMSDVAGRTDFSKEMCKAISKTKF